MIKMELGINLRKSCKSFLLIIVLIFFQTKNSISNEVYFPYQCIEDDKNFELIINKFEKELTFFKEKKLYSLILSDLYFVYYCYKQEKKIKTYLDIFESLIDEKIISKNTYNNLDYEENFFKKDNWESLFLNYILAKSAYKRRISNNILEGQFPKNLKEFEYVMELFTILSIEKKKNFKKIVNLIYFSYLEDNIQYRLKILELLNEYSKSALEYNDLESYIIVAKIKSEIIDKPNEEYCKNFYEDEIKKELNIYKIKNNNIRRFYTDLKILELNEFIVNLYENLFYCIPLSFPFANEYAEIVKFLLTQENSENVRNLLEDKHLQVVFWQLDNSKKIGADGDFKLFLKTYETLLSRYDTNINEKIKFEIFRVKNTDEFFDYNKKEKKVIELLRALDDLNFEDYIKRNQYLDKNNFEAEKIRLKMEILKIYSDILLSTGRKIQAVKILEDQINFYESFRSKNNFSAIIIDEKLADYKDTNQILPDLYHQIITLFTDLKDKENYKNYSNLATKLCNKLELKQINYECYRINLSILRGTTKFSNDIFTKNEIVELINKVDKVMNNFLVSEEFKKHSKQIQARFRNDYLNSIQFGLIALSPFSNREIINFKYRNKNHAYFYICEDDWHKEYLKNASLNKDIYQNAELGIMATQSACLMNSGNDSETEEVEKKYLEYLFTYLDEHEKKNLKTNFKYLDTSGKTDKLIFHISGFYEYVRNFKTISDKEKFELKNRIFKNLQYEQAKILTKTNKNFLNKYINEDLSNKINQRNEIKIKYNNLISKILYEENLNDFIEKKENYEREIDKINEYIRKNYKDFVNYNQSATFNLKDVQKHLGKNEALIYLINEEFQQAFIITSSKALLISDPYLTNSRTKDLLGLSKKYIISEFNQNFNQNVNTLIYNTFFKKIVDNLNDQKKLIIITDKYFSSYPFEMMISNRQNLDIKKLDQIDNLIKPKYLIQDYELSYLPNVEIFINLKNSKKTILENNSVFLGIGDPKLTKSKENKEKSSEEIKFLRNGSISNSEVIYNKYDELPYTNKELIEMSKTFTNAKILLKEKANEKDIKNMNLSKFDIISFATHAEIYGNFSEYEEPFLVLTPPKISSLENDGLLTTSEISELKLNSKLIILSACNTNYELNKYAEGYSGLVSAFFTAGSKSVISTHWPVEDKAGYILMTETIKNAIQNKISIPDALRQTKIKFIEGEYGEEYKKPFYWAPYIYVGI